jgi:aryl-alcohol dehydrogenase-like predicted oxidoreductase
MSGSALQPTRSRLALGTVQFGLAYGVANRSGQVPSDEVMRILAAAQSAGLDTLDTAMDYGGSEAGLGNQGVTAFRVVTKLSALPDDVEDVQAWVQDKVQASLQRLQVTNVHGLLLHRPHQLWGAQGPALVAALQSLKARGLVHKIGVSIYGPEELDALWTVCPPDLVQAPFSLIDRRLHASGWLDRLYQAGVEVHVRSAFLQGLLLMSRYDLPEKFGLGWPNIWNAWHAWLAAHPDVSAAEACLGFVQGFPQVDRVVVGVDSLIQFKHLVAASSANLACDWPEMGSDDVSLVNPAKWNQP